MSSGHDESRTWKAVAYDKMITALQGSEMGDACDFMMDANVKILIFENNQKADEFKKLIGALLHE